MPVHGNSTRFEGIQALRFVAALLVLVTHSTFYVAERLLPGYPVWSRGAAGVDIFFVISGFVMVVSSRDLLGKPNAASVFFIRRIARIVPLYWMATTVKLLAVLVIPAAVLRADLNFNYVLSSYLFLPARDAEGGITPLLGVGWTLNFEMFFYLVFAIALATRISPYRFVGVIFGGLAVLALFRTPEWPTVAFWADTIVLEFVAGMLLARVCHAGFALPTAPAFALLVMGLIGLLYPWGGALPDFARVLTWGVPAIAVVTAVAMLEPVLRGRVPGSLLLLGEASYALYLFHPLLSPAAPTVLAKFGIALPLLSVTLSVSIGVIAALLINRWAEKPASSWLRRRLEAICLGSDSAEVQATASKS